MKNQKVLIIGPPFSGKSYISSKLKEKGVNAIDADKIDSLSKWVNENGDTVQFPDSASQDWLSENKFVWDREVLENFLGKEELPVYVFGVSSNVFYLKDLFDKSFFLEMSPQLLLKRMSNNKRTNPRGNTEEQRNALIESLQKKKEKALSYGFIPIPADSSSEQILEFIKEYN
jgi:shikimate kinase